MIGISRIWRKFRLQTSMLAVFLTLWLIFSVYNPRAFANPYTYTSLLSSLAANVVVALALTYILILGEIDLSFASIMSLSAWVMSAYWNAFGPSPVGVILAVLTGLGAGLLNAVIIVKGHLSSFIATLGTFFFWEGAVAVITQGFAIPLGNYTNATTFRIFVSRIGNFPVEFLWPVGVAIVLWVVLNKTTLGAHIYFCGDNRRAFQMMGGKPGRVIAYAFAIEGMASAIGGILATLEIATFFPMIGSGFLLTVIAATVIGGTPLTGGTGTLFGTFIGGLMLGWITLGLLAVGISGYWTEVLYGFLIVVALAIQTFLREREARRV